MYFDIKVALVCLALGLLSGLAFGHVISGEELKGVEFASTVLSGLAGMVTAIIAFVALKRWRLSHDYTIAWQNLKELEKSIEKAQQSSMKLLKLKLNKLPESRITQNVLLGLNLADRTTEALNQMLEESEVEERMRSDFEAISLNFKMILFVLPKGNNISTNHAKAFSDDARHSMEQKFSELDKSNQSQESLKDVIRERYELKLNYEKLVLDVVKAFR